MSINGHTTEIQFIIEATDILVIKEVIGSNFFINGSYYKNTRNTKNTENTENTRKYRKYNKDNKYIKYKKKYRKYRKYRKYKEYKKYIKYKKYRYISNLNKKFMLFLIIQHFSVAFSTLFFI